MKDINADDHQVFHRNLTGPELPAQLAVDLQGHFLYHRTHLDSHGHQYRFPRNTCFIVHLLLIADGLEVNHLTGHRLLNTT